MKLDERGATYFLDLPAEEAEKVIEAMKQAEQAGDTEALKWCARRLAWLDEASEIIDGDANFYPARSFNKSWAETLKSDPPPESISAIIARIDEDKPEKEITAADAGEALETVRAFLEENLGGKSYRAAMEKLGALKEAVETAGNEV
jgi:hypothetical protein